jgi:phage baseplate assembly protein W
MPDLSLSFGGDLALSATGDLATATGTDLVTQRILRRLLTNAGDYIWQPGYGAALAQYLGNPANQNNITATILAQMKLEASVLQSPAPTVAYQSDNAGTVTVTITYVDADTGTTQTLTLPAA